MINLNPAEYTSLFRFIKDHLLFSKAHPEKLGIFLDPRNAAVKLHKWKKGEISISSFCMEEIIWGNWEDHTMGLPSWGSKIRDLPRNAYNCEPYAVETMIQLMIDLFPLFESFRTTQEDLKRFL